MRPIAQIASFQFRIILVICVILFIGGTAGGLVFLGSERRDMTGYYAQSALTLAQTVRQQLERDMYDNSPPEHIQEDLASIVARSTTVRKIAVLSGVQKVYASSSLSETGTTVNDEIITRALETAKPAVGTEAETPDELSVILPLLNGPECQSCHGPQTRVLGAIEIHVDKSPLYAQMASQARIMWLVIGGGVVAAGAVLTYSLRRVVIMPTRKIIIDVEENAEAEREKQAQLYLTDRLASIGELASGVAHELNNPLTSIIGFSELLAGNKDLPPQVQEDLGVINKEAQRTANIVRNLLTFARRHPQARVPVDINAAIKNVLSLRAYDQKLSNIEVTTHFAPDLPQVMGDSFQLQQVFMNIIINAEYFMKEAHGRGSLIITTERLGDNVRVSFADDGPGIPKENLDRIFVPFYTTKGVGKGTGLGLSICHGVVTEHSGRIYAESEVGKGATFTVELPLTQKDNDSA